MLFAVTCVSIAFLLYTIVIWSERITRKLLRWMIGCFFLGFAFDVVGTSIMAVLSKHPLLSTTHGKCGVFALAVMFLHLIWATLSVFKEGKCQKYFTKYSIYAWFTWLIALITGMCLT